jgi:hypothetical protein
VFAEWFFTDEYLSGLGRAPCAQDVMFLEDPFTGAKLIVLFVLSCRLLEQIVSAKLQQSLFRFVFFSRRGDPRSYLRKLGGIIEYRAPIFDMNTQHLPELRKIYRNRSVTPLLIEILKYHGTRGFVPDD